MDKVGLWEACKGFGQQCDWICPTVLPRVISLDLVCSICVWRWGFLLNLSIVFFLLSKLVHHPLLVHLGLGCFEIHVETLASIALYGADGLQY